MRRGSAGLFLGLFLGLICAAPSPAFAQTFQQLTNDSLKGLPGVGLVLEDVGDEARRDGLTVDALKADIELLLSQAGIRLFKAGDPAPTLYINVIPARNDIGIYTVKIEVDLLEMWQPLPVNREPVLKFMWQGWTESRLDRRNVESVREIVKEITGRFVSDWLSVNPKSR